MEDTIGQTNGQSLFEVEGLGDDEQENADERDSDGDERVAQDRRKHDILKILQIYNEGELDN